MPELIELAVPTEILRALGLPEMRYPVRAAVLATIDTSTPPLAEMLFGLQCASANDERGWPQLEPAMERLSQLLARDTRKSFSHEFSGPNWWLRLGGVDLKTTIVTVQRGNELIAALQPTRDGRLCVCTYRPLDAKSADYLTALGQTPHPETGVCMRADNWAFALDYSVGMGNPPTPSAKPISRIGSTASASCGIAARSPASGAASTSRPGRPRSSRRN